MNVDKEEAEKICIQAQRLNGMELKERTKAEQILQTVSKETKE